MFETDLGVPYERKFEDKAIIYSTQCQNLTGRIRERGGDWRTYFHINTSEQEIDLNPADARFIQWNFSEASQNPPFQFEGLSFNSKLTTNKYAK